MIQFLNAATGTATTAEMLMSFLPMILIIVFMIVLIDLPQKRQDKKDAAMRNSIEIGDKVTTIGGIVGTVVDVKESRIVLETGADQVRIELEKWAISTNETAAENAKEEAKKAQEAKAKAKAAKKAEKNQ